MEEILMATSRRDFIKKGSLLAVAAAVPASIAQGAARREVIVPANAEPELTKAAFKALVNTEFRISNSRSQLIVKLVDVSDLAHRRGARAGKEGFSLLFRGPAESTLPQNTYAIEHAKLGTFSFLLVPVRSKNNNHAAYEAIVNRLYP